MLWIGSCTLDTLSCMEAKNLSAATFAMLTFTTQKTGFRNETIGHGRSGHPFLCPVHCLASRVAALRRSAATPLTPLNAVHAHTGAPFQHILPSDITRRTRTVTVRSTRAGGAMVLLCAGVDSDRIRLGGGDPTKCTGTCMYKHSR